MESRAQVHAGAVLALDFGERLGWACRHVDGAVRYGTQRFESRGGIGYRFLRFRVWLTEFKNSAGGLEMVWYEDCPFGNVTPAIIFGGFAATMGAWCEHHRIPYRPVHARTIKKFATNDGNAKKPAMMDAMRQAGYDPKTDDEADALALLLLAMERIECGRAA